MSDSIERDSRCPWPGPVPYTVELADRFGGRSADVETVTHMLMTQPVTVLTGRSGVGKTSLVRAGLIPRLRRLQTASNSIVGPILMVRNWARPKGQSIPEVFAAGVRKALAEEIDRGQAWKSMASVSFAVTGDAYERRDAAVGYIQALCDHLPAGEDDRQRLILIIDQGEEMLGSGLSRQDRGAEYEAVDLLAALCRANLRAKILLSLRSEYVHRLRGLENLVGPSARLQYVLHPLTWEQTEEAIRHSHEGHTGLEVVEDVRNKLVRLAGGGPTADRAEADSSGDGDGEANLLGLQAMLLQLFRFAARGIPETAVVKLSHDAFDRFVRETAGGSDADVMGRAIIQWVQDSLKGEDGECPPYPIALLRRVLVRIVPQLSSFGSFKRHEDETILVLSAIRDDLLRLLSNLPINEDPDEHLKGPLMQLRDKKPAAFDALWRKDGGLGSGALLRAGADEVARHLAESAYRTLELLKEGNVLKQTPHAHGFAYELVHDGLAAPLSRWARIAVGEFADAAAAVCAIRGSNFTWGEVTSADIPQVSAGRDASSAADGVLRRVRWLGCCFEQITFEGITFRECDLRGCVFRGCIFRDCGFEDCILSGCVFEGGKWEDVKLLHCDAKSILVVGGTEWLASSPAGPAVTFIRSDLENATIVRANIGSDVRFEGCSARFSQIARVDFARLRVDARCDFANASVAGPGADAAKAWPCEPSRLPTQEDDLPPRYADIGPRAEA